MYRITFSSDKPAEEIAKHLSLFIFPDCPVDEDVPFIGHSGEWWELSRGNDHKLDMLGGNKFAYRDRYAEPRRMIRIECAIRDFGGTDIRRN